MLPNEDGFKIPETRVNLNCERRNQHVYSATRGKYASKEEMPKVPETSHSR